MSVVISQNPECNRPGQLGTNDDGSWWARCGCGVLVMESGTYEEVCAALEVHRAESTPPPA